jgi:hypothetical protein
MIVEMRTYQIRPTQAGEFLRIYRESGLSIQTEILGRMIGCFSTEIGSLNQVITLWAFQSYDDRTRRRDELAGDPRWKEYVDMIAPLIVSQENKLLTPATVPLSNWKDDVCFAGG